MTVRRRIALALLCALTCAPIAAIGQTPAATPSDTTPEWTTGTSGVRPQVYPAAQLSALFPAAVRISFAVAVVPDPLVPRYRRPYDLELVALELGMLRDGYVLDRFYLPWSDELRTASLETSASQQPPPLLKQLPMRYRYGLMIFRCDGWRSSTDVDAGKPVPPPPKTPDPRCNAPTGDPAAHGTRIRALYLVTDTATKGIESDALLCAIDRINSQLPPRSPGLTPPERRFERCWPWPPVESSSRATLLAYPDACHAPQPSSTLLVLGPNFSGGVDSAGEVGKQLEIASGGHLAIQPIQSLCLLSSSATDTTNERANNAWAKTPFNVSYKSLALENQRKLRNIVNLLPALVGGQSRVAFLAEASTYGYGVCGYSQDLSADMLPEARNLCNHAKHLYFPANISDIRYGMQQDQQRRTADNPLKLETPTGHLSLDLGAENGSEYPESRQSGLTSVGVQLALEQVLGQLREDPPKVVIVVATDVRDRLFLFDELRKRLARAMLIDLEADNLIAHPDFLHASRGALAIGSAELTTQGPTYGCETPPPRANGKGALDSNGALDASDAAWHSMSSWSTDFQAMLADAVSRLYALGTERSEAPCEATSFKYRPASLQLITLEGLKSITRKPGDAEQRGTQEADRQRSDRAASIAGNPPVDAAAIGPPAFQALDVPGSAPGRAMMTVAETTAPFFCLGAAWLLIGPLVLPHLLYRPDRPKISLVDSVAGGICLLYPIAPILVARSLHAHDHDNLVLLGTSVVLFAALVGLAVCARQLRHVGHTARPANLRNIAAPALLALAATGFALTPSIWYARINNTAPDYLDVSELEAIALDPDPGLAFLLLVALATIVMLYACTVLATTAGIVNRNSAVLREENPETKPSAQPVRPRLAAPAAADWVSAQIAILLPGTVEPGSIVLAMQPLLAAPPLRWLLAHLARGRALTVPQPQRTGGRRGALNLNPLSLFWAGALIIAALVAPDVMWGDLRLTVFGPLASLVALLSLAATTIAATLLLCCSLGLARRISAISRHLATARVPHSSDGVISASPHDAREHAISRWPCDGFGPRVFPPTPVVARATDGGSEVKRLLWAADLADWRKRISEWLHHGDDDGKHRIAVFALLATEISLFRWCVIGTTLCALASIGAVYLFPIEADSLLMFNLLVLVGVGAVAALAATTFERDTLLSNVLCNRPAPRKFSTPLFVFTSVPFIALAVALAIAQIPGVLDWGGGVLQLLKAFGLHP